MNFLGMDNASIFFGVVEDREDPKKLGRIRVRIFGLHDEKLVPSDKTGRGIPTEDLPWAYPIQDINSASMNGIGTTPIGPVEGTNVIGFARDEAFQDLIVFGTIGGIPQEEANTSRGFNDPNGKYPKSDFVGEPDTNRLARNEKIDKTVVKTKKDNVDSGVSTANGAEGSWDEPETPYDAKYPYNHVFESETGHIFEIDDTEDIERLHEYHTSGTFEEIHPDGTKVTKVVNKNFEIVVSNENIHIQGNQNITVNGNTTFYVKGNEDNQTTGTRTEHVEGKEDRTVDGDQTEEFGSNVTINVSGDVSQTIGGDAEVIATGSLNLESSTLIEIVAPQIIKRS